MHGRVCFVTGANSGIGKAMATELARRGAEIVMVCRNPDKAEAAKREIVAASGNEQVCIVIADLGSQASIREAVAGLADRWPKVDVLANNAGIYLPTKHTTVDGYEQMFAVNHLGAFLLTHLLMDRLAAADAGRVVTTSSMGHRVCRLDLDDLSCERRRFVPIEQYGVSKLANILFTKELARRVADRGIVANCFHPGAVATNFAQEESGLLGFGVKIGKLVLRTAEKGGKCGVWLSADATAGELTGEYCVDERTRKPSRTARSDANAKKLWELSEQMVGLT